MNFLQQHSLKHVWRRSLAAKRHAQHYPEGRWVSSQQCSVIARERQSYLGLLWEARLLVERFSGHVCVMARGYHGERISSASARKHLEADIRLWGFPAASSVTFNLSLTVQLPYECISCQHTQTVTSFGSDFKLSFCGFLHHFKGIFLIQSICDITQKTFHLALQSFRMIPLQYMMRVVI